MKTLQTHTTAGCALFLIILAFCFFAAHSFRSMHSKDRIYPSRWLSRRTQLSAYFPGLKDTPGDSDVYIFQGSKDGGNVLILGGTHANEPAGFITAVLLVENIRAIQGKIVLLPQANSSGFTHTDPEEGSPQRFPLQTTRGKRWFRYGSRLTNPVHQWPDPTLYINPGGQKLSGSESRNLNRCYPGRTDGTLTEKIAFGIMALLQKESIDLAIDLHEAAPEYPVINAAVFHENSAELAAIALMALQDRGLDIRLEASPPKLRGLSHREWGDAAGVHAILLETANASHGRLKGKSSAYLVVEGKDKNYVKAANLGRLFVPFDEQGIPLQKRVARHLFAVRALFEAFQELYPDKAIETDLWPSEDRILEGKIRTFLHPPD